MREWGLLNYVPNGTFQRAIRFKMALHRNTYIRKAPTQIGLAGNIAELRITLRELCQPDFDEVEILLPSLAAYLYYPAPAHNWALTFSLNLIAADRSSLGRVQLRRFAANNAPFLLDLQLVARVLQPALSTRVASLIAGSDKSDLAHLHGAYSSRNATINPETVLSRRDHVSRARSQDAFEISLASSTSARFKAIAPMVNHSFATSAGAHDG